MHGYKKWLGLLAGGLAIALGASATVLVQRAPDFYVHALRQPPEKVREGARNFVRHASQLASDVENLDRWEAAFREQDVNAWLSEAFQRELGPLLPPSVQEPRVRFEDGNVVVAFRKSAGWLAPVISLTLTLWLPEPNLLAVKLGAGRAGSIPVSLSSALRQAAARSTQLGWEIEWKEHEGNPVALVRLHWEKVCENLSVEELRIEHDLFYVAGNSKGCDDSATPNVARQALRLNKPKPPPARL